MNLGERICILRNKKGFSQSELAERLEVSRQSVSKWETNASIPDLDKLMKLSTLFGVTLDELVTGEKTEEESERTREEEERKEKTGDEKKASPDLRMSGRRIAALILFCSGLLIGLTLTALTGNLLGMVFGAPLLLCALVYMIAQKHHGLWCTWLLLMILDTYFVLATGVTWPLIFLSFRYTAEMNDMRLLVAWVMLIGRLILMAATAWHLRNSGRKLNRKGLLCLMALFVLLHLPILLPSALLWQGVDWAKVICGTVLLKEFFFWRSQRQQKQQEITE